MDNHQIAEYKVQMMLETLSYNEIVEEVIRKQQ